MILLLVYQGPALLIESEYRNERVSPPSPTEGTRVKPILEMKDDDDTLLIESENLGNPDPRTFNYDVANLMTEINDTIGAMATPEALKDFKKAVKLIHLFFEAAAAVAKVAQLDNPQEQTEDLDALYDHAIAGMGLIDGKVVQED